MPSHLPLSAGRERGTFLLALLGTALVSSATANGADDSLRTLAARHGLLLGSTIRLGPAEREPLYVMTLAREFNIVTPEVEMQWEHVHPERRRYEFDRTDALFDVAEAAGLKLHGHSLVWHFQNPPWLGSNAFSRDDLIAVLRDHIQTVVGRYKGRVHLWDVVNEPIETRAWEDGFGSLHDSIWSRVIGEEYIELAFRFAHEADSSAKLIYNQVGVAEATSATSQEIIETLLLRGVPIHGVGFQLHIKLENESRLEFVPRFAARMQRFAALGLEIYITEMDVAIREPVTARKLEDQADLYRAILGTCLELTACKAFQMWGFTDKHTWVTEHRPGFAAPLLFDESYFPKASYFALQDLLRVYQVGGPIPRN